MSKKKSNAKLTPDLVAQLKAAIENSGQTIYAISKAAGIGYAVLYRFIGGERDIKLETAAKVATHLGLELKPKPPS